MSYISIENLLNKCAEPQEYNFEAESDVSDLSGKSTFEKFFTYQAGNPSSKGSGYDSERKFAEEVQDKYPIYKNFDCDGSGGGKYDKNRLENDEIEQGQLCMLSRNIYRALWGWKDIEKAEFENKMYMVKRKERYGKCGIKEFGDVGPDTMNSANTLLDLIVENIVKSHQNMEKIRIGHYSINYALELFTNKQTSDLFIEKISSVPYLREYLDEYHKMGNFILVPAYFNPYRASKVQDYWIESLVCLKEKQEDDEWIYRNRDISYNISWDANNFILYINYFFLWDYFDKNGNLIDYTLLRKNDVSEYMRKTVNHIKKRSIFMMFLLKVYCKLGDEKYEKLRKEIFENEKMIYKNYDEVFEKISIYLNNISDELLKEECEKSKLLIDKVEKANEYANKEG